MSERIVEVPIPVSSLIARLFPRRSYADAFRAPLPRPVDVETLTRLFFATVPGWTVGLLKLRNQLVRLLGLKISEDPDLAALAQSRFALGDQVGLFRVFERNEHEIVLGEDDKHLDFRVSILASAEGRRTFVTIATIVRFNGWLGQAYFLPVRPFHRLIVKAMLRRIAAAASRPAVQQDAARS